MFERLVRLGRLTRWRRRGLRSRSPRGRILAIKPGLNPNSSSLGVDVTFLLFGAALLSVATPVVAGLLRWRRPSDARAAPKEREASDAGDR